MTYTWTTRSRFLPAAISFFPGWYRVSKYLRVAISLALCSFVAWRTSWSDVADRFAGLHFELWLAAVGLLLLGLVGSAWRWQVCARELGFRRGLASLCVYNLVGMYFNLVLPTAVGGDVVRVVYLNGGSGRKWAAFASICLERANSLLVLIGFACVGRLFCPLPLPLWIDVSVWGSAATAILGLGVLWLVHRSPWLSATRREQLGPIVELIFARRLWTRMSVLSLGTQGVGLVLVWCLAVSIDLDVPFSYVCVFMPMLTLLMLLPVSVNGMGIREGGMVLFLAPLGIDAASALTLAFLLFSVGAAVSLLGGLLYVLGAAPSESRDGDGAPRVQGQGTLACQVSRS
jgi:glycosyltransferase 2 family protein